MYENQIFNEVQETEIEPQDLAFDEGLPTEETEEKDDVEQTCVKEQHETKANNSKITNKKQLYDAFIAELNSMGTLEEKLRHVIEFMVSALATNQGTPYFKGFWDARTLAIELFKEIPNSPLRTDLWNQYAELSKEARHLKETLDEQSLFASEQIEIAIKAIENEQQNPEMAIENLSGSPLLDACQSLQSHKDYYVGAQNELNLLNAHASRITALRKELIRIEMRVRQKNKFFQRLSDAGDKTFPRRKELIKELSQRFSSDVDAFVEKYFTNEDFREAVFFLREEIKLLQSVAKYLTLNTQSFTHTRMRLSECWDKLKNCDKERKKQRAQDKVLYKENADILHKKLSDLELLFKEGQASHDEVFNQLDEIVHEMKQAALGREEIKELRDQMGAVRNSVNEKARQEEQERLHQQQEREKLKKLRLYELKNEISALLLSLDEYNAIQLTARKDEFTEKIQTLVATKLEKLELERLLKPLKDAIVEKKEKEILDLSDDDRQVIEQLREVLQQRLERRQEIKKQLEILRKNSGSSGLDFMQAMSMNGQIETEKERLEKISEGIKEIQDKIALKLQAKTNDAAEKGEFI